MRYVESHCHRSLFEQRGMIVTEEKRSSDGRRSTDRRKSRDKAKNWLAEERRTEPGSK
jgi:hypothetical protein